MGEIKTSRLHRKRLVIRGIQKRTNGPPTQARDVDRTRRGVYRCLPMKNSATHPGPVWAPITGPMELMMISFTP